MTKNIQLIDEAITQLERHSGIRVEWHPHKHEVEGELTIHIGQRPYHVIAETKREIRQYQLQDIIRLARHHQRFMVIAEHIFPTIKAQLREKGIGYLDKAGNIFINDGDIYLWIDGRKPEKKVKRVANRAFTKTGLKTVFYLLLHKDAINLPHRQLALHTGVALGNIPNVIEGLRDAGFVLQLNKQEKILHNKKALLTRWIEGFREILKPALHIGDFTFGRNEVHWENLAVPENATVMWSGEAAAERITQYLAPGELTLYTDSRSPLVKAWRLIPQMDGELKIYKKFWHHEEMDREEIVPMLLVYADLLITDNPRCIEAANIIYDQYLREDYEAD